jgi:hypothetical protein
MSKRPKQKNQKVMAALILAVFLVAALTVGSTSANKVYAQQQDRLLIHIKSGTPNNFD